jgi:hypothetical protein
LTKQFAWKWKILDEDLKKNYNEMDTECQFQYLFDFWSKLLVIKQGMNKVQEIYPKTFIRGNNQKKNITYLYEPHNKYIKVLPEMNKLIKQKIHELI